MLRRYQDCDGGSKHEHLSALLRTRSPDSAADETGGAFAAVRRGAYETGDAFAGGKWSEIGGFMRAEVSAVSFRGSDPPALVPSVSGEVVGRCFEVAAAPIGAKKLAPRDWILGRTAKKFALRAQIGRFWAVLPVLGELCRDCGDESRARRPVCGARGGVGGLPQKSRMQFDWVKFQQSQKTLQFQRSNFRI